MIVLDENLPESQRQLLRGWGIHVQQIGHEVGRAGMSDEEILPLLHQLHEPTFFTRDLGFYDRRRGHASYSLVVLEVGRGQVASLARRCLRHPSLSTWAKRQGTVVRAGPRGIHLWRLRGTAEEAVGWPDRRD